MDIGKCCLRSKGIEAISELPPAPLTKQQRVTGLWKAASISERYSLFQDAIYGQSCASSGRLGFRPPFEHSKSMTNDVQICCQYTQFFNKSEAAVELPGNVAINNPSSANIQLPVTMDGKNLQMLLNKRWNEHDSMHDEVLTVLRQTSDPAKLVLDAMQGFYPMHLENGNMDVEVSVIRRSCILFLEQLMKVSPEIRPHVKEGAMKLSFDWMTKMRPTAENYLEVLGFLLLVASYGLVSAFDEEELVSLLQIVAKHRQAPELCRVLGLADMMPYFINNLITRKQNLDAIRFIYACELVDKFPPVPLLKDYMKFSKMDAKKLFMNGNTSLEAQNEATNKRISDLRAVIRCIEDHKLGCKDLYKNLEKFIAQLEQKMKNCTSTAPTPAPNGRLRQKNKKKLRSTTPSQVEIKQSTSDGTSWILLPSKCVKKRDLAKFVLDKIKQLYPLNLEGDKGMNFIALKRCILSLEQLMNVSPLIKPHVKEEAMKFAVDCKVKLNEKIEGHSLYVLGFLQLLATYRLASSFDVDELLGLFYNIYRRKQAPALFQVLGLTDKIPDFIQNLIEKEQQPLEAIRYIYKLKLVDKFSPIHILEDYFSHSKKLAEELCEKGNNSLEAQIRAIDKEVAALRAVVRCTAEYKLGPKYSPEILKERCEQLEKTKAGILKVLYSEGRGGPWSEYKSKLRQNQTRQSKRKCFSPTTTSAASTPAPSTSIIPTPGVAPEAQLQEQSGDKRPRISVSAEAAPCDSINATSTIHSIQQQQPCQQPAGLFTNHHEPYLTTSATQYSLSSFPPVNQNMRSCTQNSTPYYPPFRQPCNYNRPMLFNGPWDEHRAPGHHVGPAPFGSYGLPPPQYNPSSYP
ncbi:hypothetical protein L1049_019674 [Liquidambar formosana]|uniref:FRIGIDA-like protein n=1 Tax=Liquidambar formosana TaxID=63359 RepID=A0AAP0SBZ5_LIQFO